MSFKLSTIILSIFIFVSICVPIESLVNSGYVPKAICLLDVVYFPILIMGIVLKKDKYLRRNVVLLLLVWTLMIFVRGFKFEFNYIENIATAGYIFLPFTIPFIVVYLKDVRFSVWAKLITLLNVVFLSLVLINLQNIIDKADGVVSFFENAAHYLAFPNLFLLFVNMPIKGHQRVINIITYMISLVVSVYLARRGLTLTIIFSGLLAFIIFAKNFSGLPKNKVKLIEYILIFVVVVVAAILILENFTVLTGPLVERIYEDSRGSIVSDYNNDMNGLDYIIGKGIGGSYFLKDSVISGYYSDQRNIIESGFLNYILYGGLIYFFLTLWLYLAAIYRGYFRSSNDLAKAFSLFIVVALFEVYYAGVFFFDFRFLLLWVGIISNLDVNYLQRTDDDPALVCC